MTSAGSLGTRAILLPGLLVFVVLATLNSAGYRYGASDQAFYAPAVIRQLHPGFYPRDAPLIDSQARLTVADEAIAAAAAATHLTLPALFALLYTVSLLTLALAAIGLGRIFFQTPLATLTLLAAFTMRHAIAQTGTNSLEGYFHPRQLAFAVGAWAVACFLRGRDGRAAVLVALAALVHSTTALWFAVWLTVGAVVATQRLRKPALAGGVALAIVAAWLLTAGPLGGRLHAMDAAWLATLTTKDYLFPLEWPWSVWAINLGYPAVIIWLYRVRRAQGRVVARETAVVVGCLSLVALFALSLPFNAAHVQLAIQLQPARIFWILDFMATIYVVWALVEGGRATVRRQRLVAALVCLLTVSRGLYVAFVAFPTRPMFATGLPDSDWGRAMAWARQSAPDSHWLADPMHASLYGTSLRVAGERDVLVERGKDQAIGMYDRAVAMRTRDRVAAIGDFHTLTPDAARHLASIYGLDFLVTEAHIDLPVAYAAGALTIYRLR